MRFPALVLLTAACAFSAPAGAFISYATVVEYFNEGTGHYFLTADNSEMLSIRNGAAGPGWRATGYQFQAYDVSLPLGGVPVCRFYAPSPNSHFFTASAEECDIVKRGQFPSFARPSATRSARSILSAVVALGA